MKHSKGKKEKGSDSDERSMGDMEENMGKRLGKKNVVIRYIDMDNNGVWGRDMGLEGKKGDRGDPRKVYKVDYGARLENIRLHGKKEDR